MNPKSETIEEQLSEVADTGELVRIRRSIRQSDRVEGFVVGRGERWLLLHLLNPSMFLDGYAAVRLVDIRRIERRGGNDSFPLRALQHFGESPRVPDGVGLDTTDELLSSLATMHHLLTIYVEERDPDVCYIGKLVSVSKRNLRLREINPDASWGEKATKWPLTEITRVEIGGRYEHALHAVGGDPVG